MSNRNHRNVWASEMESVSKVLKPFMFSHTDQFGTVELIAPEAPKWAVDLHRGLVSAGYANGFFA